MENVEEKVFGKRIFFNIDGEWSSVGGYECHQETTQHKGECAYPEGEAQGIRGMASGHSDPFFGCVPLARDFLRHD